jgi:hypothetical protein
LAFAANSIRQTCREFYQLKAIMMFYRVHRKRAEPASRLGHLRISALALFLLPVLSSSAQARFGSGIDAMENIFGATNINAVTGHGRLTVGVSKEGDLTVLSWPGPAYADQLAYLSSNDVDARAQPHFGAPDGAGFFLGLVIETSAGRQVSWLRDKATWSSRQDYGPQNGPNPHTVFTAAQLGLTVTIVDAIDPQRDVMVRNVRVKKAAGSPVSDAWLLTYANLSPTPVNSRTPKLAAIDWMMDGRNDYAAIWDADRAAVVHFHPSDERVWNDVVELLGPPNVAFGPIGTLLRQKAISEQQIAATAAALDRYHRGVYLTLTTRPRPDQHQIGFDETPFCAQIDRLAGNIFALPERFPNFKVPVNKEALEILRCKDGHAPDFRAQKGWQYRASDAFADAADGELQNSGIAAGEVNEALRTPLTFIGDEAVVNVVLTAGASAKAARELLDQVDPGSVAAAAQTALSAFVDRLRLPKKGGEVVRRVARRSLINVRVGTDAQTGAIVASIARQPPYYLDWPRDGAFFNLALDISGQSALVTKRADLYDRWQRKTHVPRDTLIDAEPPPYPDGTPCRHWLAGGWEMNYLPDGSAGGIFRFEIDTTAFAIWTMVAHVGWLAPNERVPYLQRLWPAIRAGADLIADWRDPQNGLQAPAQEDDSGAHTQTLHGATTVFGALELVSRAARLIGAESDAERWENRAAELRGAIVTHLYDRDGQRFVMGETQRGPFAASGLTPTGPSAWVVWPMTVLPLSDLRVQRQVDHDLAIVRPMIDLQEVGGLYFMKNTNAASVALLGLSGGARDAREDEMNDILRKLASHATKGTDQFGEVMVAVDGPNGKQPEQRTANPHLWEATLFYLSAIAAEDPRALLRYDAVLPASRVDAAPTVEQGGCSVSRWPRDGHSGLMLLLLLAVCALVSRVRLRRMVIVAGVLLWAASGCSNAPQSEQPPPNPSWDVKAPDLQVSEPARGTVTDAASITVRGKVVDRGLEQVSVTVNGQSVVLNTDGSFRTEVLLPKGTSFIVTEAEDKYGNRSSDTRSVLNGAQASPPWIDRAIVARLNAQTLSVLSRVIEKLLLKTDLGAVAQSFNPWLDQPGCLGVVANVNTVKLDKVAIQLTAARDKIKADIKLEGIQIGGDARYRVLCVGETAKMTVKAARLHLVGNLKARVSDGQLLISLEDVTSKLDGYDLEVKGSLPLQVLELFDFFPGTVANTLSSMIQKTLPDVVNKTLADFMKRDLTFDLAQLAGAYGEQLEGLEAVVRVRARSVSFTPQGGTVTLDGSVAMQGHAAPAIVPTPQSQQAPVFGQRGFEVAIAQDLVNQALAALWSAGGLSQTVDVPPIAGNADLAALVGAVSIDAAAAGHQDRRRRPRRALQCMRADRTRRSDNRRARQRGQAEKCHQALGLRAARYRARCARGSDWLRYDGHGVVGRYAFAERTGQPAFVSGRRRPLARGGSLYGRSAARRHARCATDPRLCRYAG